MGREHTQFLLLLSAMIGLMLCFSLGVRQGSRLYRWTGRIFWAALFLVGAQEAGLMGLNPMNLIAVSLLGSPGAIALAALSLI